MNKEENLIIAPKPLSEEEIIRLAPSVFAKGMRVKDSSERYVNIPTEDVLNILGEKGFVPVDAEQEKARGLHAAHRVILLPSDDIKTMQEGNMSHIEGVVLENSSNRRRKLVLYPCYYRGISQTYLFTNGLRGEIGHAFVDDESLPGALTELVDSIEKLIEYMVRGVQQFKETNIDEETAITFAGFALFIRYKSEKNFPQIPPERLLLDRRRGKLSEFSLWDALTIIQENLTKGGLLTEKNRRSLPLTAYNTRSIVNTRLWLSAEAILMGGVDALQVLGKEFA